MENVEPVGLGLLRAPGSRLPAPGSLSVVNTNSLFEPRGKSPDFSDFAAMSSRGCIFPLPTYARVSVRVPAVVPLFRASRALGQARGSTSRTMVGGGRA